MFEEVFDLGESLNEGIVFSVEGGIFDPLFGDPFRPHTGEIPLDPPVLTAPVFERPGGGTPQTVSPLEPELDVPFHQGFFEDVIDVGRGIGDIFSGGGGDAAGGFGTIGDIFRRRTTSAEERVLSGDFFEGDIARAIGNIGQEITGLEGIGTGLQVINQLLPTSLTQGASQVATQIAPCPVGGGSAGFPAGQCVTIGDWQQMGAPKGFEVAGVSTGGTLILRKKRRRRRRSGLTKGMMTDVDYLSRKLGKPAAETYLNRVL